MKPVVWSFVLIVSTPFAMAAVTRMPSADGQFWDIQDTSPWAQDSGGIATGGGANPFNGFGYLKLQVRLTTGAVLAPHQYLHGFALAYDGAERFDSIEPVFQQGIVVGRSLVAPKDTNYLRYVDRYTNVADQARVVSVAWGGASGAFDDGGRVTVATTSTVPAEVGAVVALTVAETLESDPVLAGVDVVCSISGAEVAGGVAD